MPEPAVPQELTYSQQRAIDDAYEEGRRKLWLAYLGALLPVALFSLGLVLRSFILFFGLLGIHRFYLGRNLTAVLMLVLWQAGFLSLSFGPIFLDSDTALMARTLVSAPFMFGAFIWFFVDLALMPRMVRRYNERLAENLRKDYTSEGAA